MQLAILFLSLTVALPSAAIKCLHINDVATATWVNAKNESCTWTGKVGMNLGKNTVTNSTYDCNGRCGAGCDGQRWDGDPYTQNCWNHDICSYFNNATCALEDPNCGDAFRAAMPDFLFGHDVGCSRPNPTYSASPPKVTPVCIPINQHHKTEDL